VQPFNRFPFATARNRLQVIISEEDIIPNRASGYRVVKDELKNQKFVSPSNYKTADGSLCWSVLDMAKWADAARTKALLKPDSCGR